MTTTHLPGGFAPCDRSFRTTVLPSPPLRAVAPMIALRAVAPLIALLDGLEVWIERGRERRTLATLDDRMLADIGVGRAEARAEWAKPVWRR